MGEVEKFRCPLGVRAYKIGQKGLCTSWNQEKRGTYFGEKCEYCPISDNYDSSEVQYSTIEEDEKSKNTDENTIITETQSLRCPTGLRAYEYGEKGNCKTWNKDFYGTRCKYCPIDKNYKVKKNV